MGCNCVCVCVCVGLMIASGRVLGWVGLRHGVPSALILSSSGLPAPAEMGSTDVSLRSCRYHDNPKWTCSGGLGGEGPLGRIYGTWAGLGRSVESSVGQRVTGVWGEWGGVQLCSPLPPSPTLRLVSSSMSRGREKSLSDHGVLFPLCLAALT